MRVLYEVGEAEAGSDRLRGEFWQEGGRRELIQHRLPLLERILFGPPDNDQIDPGGGKMGIDDTIFENL